MRDSRSVMIKFVKIVERYPEIYDRDLDANRWRHTDLAWEKVADSVRREIREECTVEELKIKWKGIRSSLSRYKNKLYQNNNDESACKKYYLYDALKFLDPHTVCKGVPSQFDQKNTFEKYSNFGNATPTTEGSKDYKATDAWNQSELKSDPYVNDNNLVANMLEKNNSIDESSECEKGNKRMLSYSDNSMDDDCEDLHFFKSILPDIRDFTKKEKRKLKIGILELIDGIENERKT